MTEGNKFDKPNKYDHLERITEEPEFCTAVIKRTEYDGKGATEQVCGILIETMTWKGTGVCGDLHNKVKKGEKIGEAKALTP